MCRVLGVARAGYYDWLKHPVSNRARKDARLIRLIRASFVASHGIYGAPRILIYLQEGGETCSKHRVERLMRENGLRAPHGCRTRRIQVIKPALLIPNILQRQFMVLRPNEAWVTDTTYIRTWLRHQANDPPRTCLGSPHQGYTLPPTSPHLIHSDQGTQSSSDAWRRFCKANHLEPSLSRRGSCWDNAVAESFFGGLKKERIKKRIYANRDAAVADISEYIEEFYNQTRCPSYLGGIGPEEFESTHKHPRSCVH